MFSDDYVEGNKFLFLDLDVIIHQDLKYFFELSMDKPWIVRGWWNNMETVKKNYAVINQHHLTRLSFDGIGSNDSCPTTS